MYEELPHGFSIWKAERITSNSRPPRLVENEDEVRLSFAEAKQPKLSCGYCGDPCETRDSVDKAVRWFHAHDCRTQEQAECEALILSLRPLAKTTFAESLSSEAA